MPDISSKWEVIRGCTRAWPGCLHTELYDHTDPIETAPAGGPWPLHMMSCDGITMIDEGNYMNYTSEDCYSHFSQDQVDKMNAVLDTSRSSWV